MEHMGNDGKIWGFPKDRFPRWDEQNTTMALADSVLAYVLTYFTGGFFQVIKYIYIYIHIYIYR